MHNELDARSRHALASPTDAGASAETAGGAEAEAEACAAWLEDGSPFLMDDAAFDPPQNAATTDNVTFTSEQTAGST
jgi:hypothetical protein